MDWDTKTANAARRAGCEGCNWWSRQPSLPTGLCREKGPRTSIALYWPQTHERDFCGMWVERQEVVT